MTYDGLTDPLGQSQILPYLMSLQSDAVKITIISFEKKHKLTAGGEAIQAQLDALGIAWHALPYTNSPPLASTWMNIRRLYRLASSLHADVPFDAVHCRSYVTALVGLRLKRNFGVRFLFDMRGFWADERVEGGLWKLSNPIFKRVYNFFKRKEQEFLREADAVISLTSKGKEVLLNEIVVGYDPDRITVIPCCADTDHFDRSRIPVERTVALKKELGLEDADPVVGYVGSVGTWYMLPEMMDLFNAIKEENPSARFLLLTGEASSRIRPLLDEKGIDPKDVRIEFVDRKVLPDHFTVMDLALCFIKPVFSKLASSPTKLAELFSTGVPVLCNKGVGDGDALTEEAMGLSAIGTDSSSLSEAASKLEDYRSVDREKLRALAVERLSLRAGVESYKKVYDKLAAL